MPAPGGAGRRAAGSGRRRRGGGGRAGRLGAAHRSLRETGGAFSAKTTSNQNSFPKLYQFVSAFFRGFSFVFLTTRAKNVDIYFCWGPIFPAKKNEGSACDAFFVALGAMNEKWNDPRAKKKRRKHPTGAFCRGMLGLQHFAH